MRRPSLKAKAKLALAKPRQRRGRARKHNNGGVFARSTPRPSFDIGDGQPPDFQVGLMLKRGGRDAIPLLSSKVRGWDGADLFE